MKKSPAKLVAAVLAAAAMTSAIACPALAFDGSAASYNGHHYKMYDVSDISWWDAYATCEEMGGHLVTINSKGEQQFIEALTEAGTKNGYWIGAACTNGVFYWITDYEGFDYTNFAPGEPNGEGDDMYLQLLRNSGKWDDTYNCYAERRGKMGKSTRGYICEWDY